MKKVCVLQCFFVLLIVGCATKTDSYWEYPSAPVFPEIQVRSVNVSINHVNEKDIADQIATMFATRLIAGQQYEYPHTGILHLDIDIIQRTYLVGIKEKNTLYINCELIDEDGVLYGVENMLLHKKETIISVLLQNEYAEILVKKILREQSKQSRLVKGLKEEKNDN